MHEAESEESEADEDALEDAPAGRGGSDAVLAREKVLRSALMGVAKGMENSFSCLFQLALGHFRVQMYAKAKEAVGKALAALRHTREVQKRISEARFAALEAKMMSLHAQCCVYERHSAEGPEKPETANPAEIQSQLVQATKVDNMQPAIWNNIGLLYMSLDKFDGAKAVLQPILANFPEYNDGVSNLGLSHLCSDDVDAAANLLQTVILRDSSHIEALNNYAVLLLRQQAYSSAIVFFERAIDRDPSHSYIWSNLACAYSGEGRHVDAAKAFRHARELDETNVAVTCNLAHHIAATIHSEADAAARATKFQQAEHMYSSVLCDQGEQAGSAQAWTGLAALFKVQTELADQDEKRVELRSLALEAFSQALDTDPSDPVVWTQVGLLNLAEGDYKRAEMCFRNGIQRSPNILSAWCNLGVALQLGGSTNEAILMYAKALASFSNSHEIYNNMGNLYRQLGKLEEAQTAFATCLRLNPEYALGHNNLALVHILQGKYPEARKCLQEAMAIDPALDAAKSNLLKLNWIESMAQQEALRAKQEALRPPPP